MKAFTIAEAELPFNFFEEIDFSYDEIAIVSINNKYTYLSRTECEKVFEENYNAFTEELYKLRNTDAINDYCIGEVEIDESTGTWGYLHCRLP